MEQNFLYNDVLYKDSWFYEKSTVILHLYRNISVLVYNLNIRQYVSTIVINRMSSQVLSQHEMQMYVGIGTSITLHILNNLLAQKWPLGVSETTLYTELEL
jgi:hypothetical protein